VALNLNIEWPSGIATALRDVQAPLPARRDYQTNQVLRRDSKIAAIDQLRLRKSLT
jgi:hypothetical protein